MDARSVCLAVLTKGDASGYEIRKNIVEGPFSNMTQASFGSVYPALRKLDAEGLVECREQAQDNRPDKKVYRITQRGKLALLDELASAPGEDRLRSEFLFRMCFAHLLPVRFVEAMIDTHADRYRAKLDHLNSKPECAGVSPGVDFVRGFARAMCTAAVDYLDGHRHELLANIAVAGEIDSRPAVDRMSDHDATAHDVTAPPQAAE